MYVTEARTQTNVATQLEANATLLESAGDAQTATALKALASQWTELANKLLPIASLNVGDEAQWAQSWTESYLAFWVNPGGLVQEGQQPQYNVKHFMILLGEDNATVA